MRAIVFNNTGEPGEVLGLAEVPVPEPGKNEVRIRVLASPLNPADILFVNGKYRIKPSFPQIAGLEGAGIIDELGENVNLPPATLVAFRHKNVWAEYTVIPIEKIIVLPNGFSIDKASQFSLNPITAFALLEEANIKTDDDWLLLTAGNSAVSKQIIQFAQLKNIKTITVTRSSDDFSELKTLGVTATLTDDLENIEEVVNEITNGKGVKCVLDAVGGELINRLIKSISQFGKLISYGLISKDAVSYHNSTIIFRNITIKGFGIDQWLSEISETKYKETIDALISILKNPDFKLPVAAKFTLAEFAKAFGKFQQTRNGKIILMP